MRDEFEGRVALVTGAASGIGRATALMFAQRGARVVCADIMRQGCEETVRLVEERGGTAKAVIADLSTVEGAEATVVQSIAAFGRLDHAFNNAGVTGAHGDPFDVIQVKRTLAINLEAVFWCMKHEIAHMVENVGGTIVNTSSIAGLSGQVGTLDYTAAKHGVVGLSGAAARRYGPQGVRVNVVCPGIIETPMTSEIETEPAARKAIFARLSPITAKTGEPDDVAEAVLFLSSDRAKFIHGVALPVDGGFSI
jgi:NAD(P)-dependent dehydrogenase (short-subunit alcohol dehydrogenase family)